MSNTFIAYADIANRDDETDLPLYWSNTLGWTDESHASLFTEDEAQSHHPPMGTRVVQVPVKVTFPLDL